MSVYIIAEAGVNHNGSLELAYRLVDAAKKAGVDCIKFQTFKSENLVAKSAQKAAYQKNTTGDGTQVDMLKKLELSFDEFVALKKYCDQAGLCFLSTPFDFESIRFLDSIEMPFWKIPSGEVTNYPYLVALAKTGKPVVMSTGMCEEEEVREAIQALRANGAGNIRLLHCNTEYPTPFEDVNLKAMQTMKDAFGLDVGYSDHTAGIEVPVAAVAMGATVIEKHFTLDRNMEGPDHKASLEPDELADAVHISPVIGQIKKSGVLQLVTQIHRYFPGSYRRIQGDLVIIRKEFVVTGLDELFLEGIITNAKVKRNRIKANASTIHSGVIVKKYQKRNFTAESLSTIHSAANSINSRTFNQTSSWTSFSGEEWYNPIGTGLILRGIQKYFEKLYSINNTSKVQIANVYETVYSLDATFANRLRSQADNMRGYAAGITDLAGTIG